MSPEIEERIRVVEDLTERHSQEIRAMQDHWIASHEDIKSAIATGEKALKVALDLFSIVRTALEKLEKP